MKRKRRENEQWGRSFRINGKGKERWKKSLGEQQRTKRKEQANKNNSLGEKKYRFQNPFNSLVKEILKQSHKSHNKDNQFFKTPFGNSRGYQSIN